MRRRGARYGLATMCIGVGQGLATIVENLGLTAEQASPRCDGPSSLLCSIDGEIGPIAEAHISITDDGFLRGDGAFEVLRLYDGKPFG